MPWQAKPPERLQRLINTNSIHPTGGNLALIHKSYLSAENALKEVEKIKVTRSTRSVSQKEQQQQKRNLVTGSLMKTQGEKNKAGVIQGLPTHAKNFAMFLSCRYS